MEGPQKGQKVALVTGVGVGGIGGALALELSKAGYFVVCAARKPETIETFCSQRPGMLAVPLDVTLTPSVTALAERVAGLSGEKRLDVLINNAGSAVHLAALDLDVDGVVRNMFDVNVLGPMRMVQTFAPLLINAKGTVVNIGSVSPIFTMPFASSYNATKAALHSYGDTLRMELEPFGVQVVTVVTGAVKSNIVKDKSPSLPYGSRYAKIRQYWLKRVNSSQDKPMPTEAYARDVTKMLARKNKPVWYWKGYFATLAWFYYYFVPRSLRFYLLKRMYGLLKL